MFVRPMNQTKKSSSLNKYPLVIAALCGLSILSTHAMAQQSEKKTVRPAVVEQQPIETGKPINPKRKPKIQMAILLDTSGSMDGLIDQTRNQLWQVVNEFTTARQNGVTPILEVALFEYGNDGISADSGYVRKLNNFTRELDRVSEGLFQLTTNGGSEYCGMAIKTAVESLQWSQSAHDLKTIFIAGNEPFTQGPINYQHAIALAKQKGISVNTIFAGNHQQGLQTGWQSGALLAGGDYMSIDANQQLVYIESPQDKKLVMLNQQLNKTYIPYGKQGKDKLRRQQEQDEKSEKQSITILGSRIKSKSSSFYDNSSWDLVDAYTEGKIQDNDLAEMEQKALPETMQSMTAEERKEYVATQVAERQKVKKEIAELSKKRDVYIAEKRQAMAASAPTVSDALTQAVKKQAKAKAFEFESQNVGKTSAKSTDAQIVN